MRGFGICFLAGVTALAGACASSSQRKESRPSAWPVQTELPQFDTTKLVTLPNDTTKVYRTDLMVAFEPGLPDSAKQSVLESLGLRVQGVTASGIFFVRFRDRGPSFEALEALVDSIRARPGVHNVALANFTPLEEEGFPGPPSALPLPYSVLPDLRARRPVCLALEWGSASPPNFFGWVAPDTLMLAPNRGEQFGYADSAGVEGHGVVRRSQQDRRGLGWIWWTRRHTLWIASTSPTMDDIAINAVRPDGTSPARWIGSAMAKHERGQVGLRPLACNLTPDNAGATWTF